MVEAPASGPVVVWTFCVDILNRNEVPFAQGKGIVADTLKHLCQCCCILGEVSVVSGIADRHIRQRANACRIMISAGHEASPGRRSIGRSCESCYSAGPLGPDDRYLASQSDRQSSLYDQIPHRQAQCRRHWVPLLAAGSSPASIR